MIIKKVLFKKNKSNFKNLANYILDENNSNAKILINYILDEKNEMEKVENQGFLPLCGKSDFNFSSLRICTPACISSLLKEAQHQERVHLMGVCQ